MMRRGGAPADTLPLPFFSWFCSLAFSSSLFSLPHQRGASLLCFFCPSTGLRKEEELGVALVLPTHFSYSRCTEALTGAPVALRKTMSTLLASRRHRVAFTVCVALLLTSLLARADDHIQVHSLLPPILKNYWANGMQFWAFGRQTVVTDNYVQLTTLDAASHGYLWNRHKNQLDAFALNVTVQMRSRDGGWFASGGDSGFGVWYTSDPKVNYQTDDAFFGFKRKFHGVGVVLDHGNELHLLSSSGDMLLTPKSMRGTQAGGCTISSLGELHATISLVYKGPQLSLFYTMHPSVEPEPQDFDSNVFCASISDLSLSSSYHFGVTAANSVNGQAMHNVHSVVMTPLSDASLHHEEEEMVGQARLFENRLEEEEREKRDGASSGTPAAPSSTTVPGVQYRERETARAAEDTGIRKSGPPNEEDSF